MKAFALLISIVLFGLSARGQVQLDSVDLMRDAKALSADKMMGRKVGTKGNRRAQMYILQQFKTLGLEKFYHTYAQSFFFREASSGEKIMGTNLMGYIEGEKDSAIVIAAHYDYLGVGKSLKKDSIYNGANDNASGVVGLLALARYFTKKTPKHTLIFVAFDAGEEGSKGAKALIRQSPGIIKKTNLVINMDRIGQSAKKELFASGTHQYPNLKKFLTSVKKKSKIKLLFGHDGTNPKQENWIKEGDQAPFYKVGIPFIYFGAERGSDEHQVTDTFNSMNPTFFYHAVQTILMATKNFDQYLSVKIKIPPKQKWIMRK